MQKTEKFSSPCARAALMATAVGGVVVSYIVVLRQRGEDVECAGRSEGFVEPDAYLAHLSNEGAVRRYGEIDDRIRQRGLRYRAIQRRERITVDAALGAWPGT